MDNEIKGVMNQTTRKIKRHLWVLPEALNYILHNTEPSYLGNQENTRACRVQ